MPVIQLPPDQRWGQLGAGLSNVLGAVVNQINDRQVSSQVAQVVQDPNVAPENKYSEVLRRTGTKGASMYLELLKSQQMQAQIAGEQALTRYRGAAAGAEEALTQQRGATLPYAAPLAQAKIGEVQARTAKEVAGTAVEQARLPEIDANIAKLRAQSQEAAAKVGDVRSLAAKRAIDSQIAQLELWKQQQAQFMMGQGPDPGPAPSFAPVIEGPQPGTGTTAGQPAPAPAPAGAALGGGDTVQGQAQPGATVTPAVAGATGAPSAPTSPTTAQVRTSPYLEGMIKSLGIPPEQADTARGAFWGAYGQRGNLEAGRKAVTDFAKSIRPEAVPSDTAKLVRESASGASAANQFLTNMQAVADRGETPTGLFSGAGFFAWMQSKGMGEPDRERLTALDTGLRLQAEQTNVGGSGGFMSAIRLRFAKDLAPNLMDTPMRNLINLDVMSDGRIQELQAEVDRFQGTKKQLTGLQNALDQWKEVQRMTRSYSTYVTKDNKTVLLHNGDTLDPGTFKRQLRADQVIQTSKGSRATGATIAQAARDRVMPKDPNDPSKGTVPAPVTPLDLVRLLGGKVVGASVPIGQ